jgi:hypothetical protein
LAESLLEAPVVFNGAYRAMQNVTVGGAVETRRM